NVIILEDIILPPKVPTGFSPNGDGENDVFLVRGGPFEYLEMFIYNKWGERIFHSQVQEEGWDGTKKGIIQPVGVYVYIIEAKTIDGVEYTKTGDVSLIR
ncbi:MAG: gliding motility-associated C-terminal domain-containing protein, partial [Bacteroidetes bacterium]|nr:gliding motility-associated C-terminal domain-containing protein [Bacteroidota bacterium]